MPLITSDTSLCHGKRDPSSYFIINYEKSTLKSSFSSPSQSPAANTATSDPHPQGNYLSETQKMEIMTVITTHVLCCVLQRLWRCPSPHQGGHRGPTPAAPCRGCVTAGVSGQAARAAAALLPPCCSSSCVGVQGFGHAAAKGSLQCGGFPAVCPTSAQRGCSQQFPKGPCSLATLGWRWDTLPLGEAPGRF